jgi:hypothetical protein
VADDLTGPDNLTGPDDLTLCLAEYDAGRTPERIIEKAAVKATLERLTEIAPGHSVEVRVPPYAAVQVVEGVRHRRGTPPALVESDARTWLLLAAGRMTWADALASGALRASGERSDLSVHLPLN